jgi:hypothetical protein
LTRKLPFACLALAVLFVTVPAYAQFTDPHSYDNAPVGTNQLEVGYAYAHADASIDSSLVITGASLNLNQGIVDYTRTFGAFQRFMWAEVDVPFARLEGSIRGTDIGGSTTGSGDSRYEVGILLTGGPALGVESFADFRPAFGLGVSLAVTAPTGSYDPDRILNLGADRWSFKPEVALRCPFGPGEKWQLDGYANVYFFTDNTAYHGHEILRQEPLGGLEAHLSYSFSDRLWASLDTRYAFRGATSVDGVDQNNAQQVFVLGSELSVSIDSRNALLFELAKALVYHNAPNAGGFSVRYDFQWGKGSR